MDKVYLYNSLTRQNELFVPIKKGEVSLYSCGPTAYNYAHIGNLRTYIFNDLLKRSLLFFGFKVKHTMNITDVDDRTIKASIEKRMSLKKLTRHYEKEFISDLKKLNIVLPNRIMRATENINEMVKIIKRLMDKGYAYKSSDGIYFSLSKSKNYGALAQLEKVKDRKSRINSDEYEKSDANDFALWKLRSNEDGKVFWKSQIGEGRPGWHIECSAMAMESFGPSIDIHTGAVDLIFPHHTNEIAQSEAYTNRKFVNFWLHGGFLNMKEGKMSKSKGNIVLLKDLREQDFSPMEFRFFCLQTHYRKPLDFSFDNLSSARNAFENIKRKILDIKDRKSKGIDKTNAYLNKFKEGLLDDINVPRALQVLFEILDDEEFDSRKKISLVDKIDEVFGLGLKRLKREKISISKEISDLAERRHSLRKDRKFAEADIIRNIIKEKGFLIEDREEDYVIIPI